MTGAAGDSAPTLPAASAAEGLPSPTVASRGRAPWRDHLEALTVAVLLAVVLKHFVIEAYKIPTGSMQPTLLGDERTGIFDRVLVDKLSYRFRDPERFEIAVFRYPLDRSKNFVKRVIGMPGEHLRIRHGDIWVRANENAPWRIPRRPRRVQRSTWKRLDRLEPDAERSQWASLGSEEPWTFTGRSIRAAGSGLARFGSGTPIVDDYADGYPDSLAGEIVSMQGSGGENRVGDLRVEARLEAGAGCEEVVLDLSEGRVRYHFRFPGPSAAPNACPEIHVEGPDGRKSVQAPSAWKLPVASPVSIAAQNLDDRLELEVGGEVLCGIDVPTAYDQSATIQVGVAGSGTTLLDELMVYRDIYYTEDGKTTETVIPDGTYFVLGDNTQDSSDSRHWTLAVYDVRTGDETTETLRGDLRRGNENPCIEYGGLEGPVYHFEDEFGERHRFLHSEIVGSRRFETAPFVARDLIQGRALAIFWPLYPRRSLYRWQWVH